MRCLVCLMIFVACSAPAQARLALCNKTAHPARVALGRFDGTAWGSEGWWTVAPGKCETLIGPALLARYYYLYASDGGSGTWDGGYPFCVGSGEKFAIAGRGSCEGRGYERKGFYQVDTHDETDVTKSLSD
ncbi:MAG TPA: DUF1036 domain-containing protein [Rhizomicrobium sp.]|jgi:uncharacterized membrane protein